jgi:hypothetical protein
MLVYLAGGIHQLFDFRNYTIDGPYDVRASKKIVVLNRESYGN